MTVKPSHLLNRGFEEPSDSRTPSLIRLQRSRTTSSNCRKCLYGIFDADDICFAAEGSSNHRLRKWNGFTVLQLSVK